VATRLVKLAEERYQLGCALDGEPYALPLEGPRIVRLLRGGRGSLRAELVQAFYGTTDTAASQSALADACTVRRCRTGDIPSTGHRLPAA
jgi:hypothetical protein